MGLSRDVEVYTAYTVTEEQDVDTLKINNIIHCADIAALQRRPVTSTVKGVLLEGVSYVRKPHHFLDVTELEERDRPYFQSLVGNLVAEPRDIFLFRFDSAKVVGQGTVILADGSLLLDSAAEFINHGIRPDGLCGTIDDLELDTNEAFPLKGVTVLVKRPWYRNFGHYLIDLAPILPALHAAGVTINNIIYGDVGEPLKTMMTKSAEKYYPDAKVLFTEDHYTLEVERLLYVQPVHVPPLFKHPKALQLSRDTCLELFKNGQSTESTAKRIYVSRQKVGTRNVVNAVALEVFLRRNQFEIVYPEQLSLSEQINMFQHADIIVGAKGAAFTNTLFCKPGTHLLALSSSSFVDPFFWDLAAFNGVLYSEIFCRALGVNPAIADFEVDLGRVERFLSSV